MKLTFATPEQDEQISSVSGRYLKADYRAAIDAVLAAKKSAVNLETSFPAVKPANVRFQLRSQIKEGEPVELGQSDELGVCLRYIANGAS